MTDHLDDPALSRPATASDDDTDGVADDADRESADRVEPADDRAVGPTDLLDPLTRPADDPAAGPDDPAVPAFLELAQPEPEPVVAPAVVAIVVAHDPGPWFPDMLRGLADQAYPNLTVVVADAGSERDLAPAVAAVLPEAFVVPTSADVGFAGVVNEIAASVDGAAYLLVCHDDAVLQPGAVRALVEEAYRSNAAVVGPKIVDHAQPELLRQVGMAVDRNAIPYSGIEPGEVDQEQHDGVRDVFFVPGAAFLVRADIFAELGGFDAALHHRAADMDLCWRARLVRARVLVVPDAVARHVGASGARSPVVGVPPGRVPKPSARAEMYRSRIRVLLKTRSTWSLLWLVPQGVVLTALAVVRFAVVGRFRDARAWAGAWSWNLRHLGELRPLRRAVQRTRQVRDSELHQFQVGTAARVRTWFVGRFDGERRARALATFGRDVTTNVAVGFREPVVAVALLLVVLVLLGTRELITGSVPSVGSLQPWPGARSLFHAFASPWRFTGIGAASPAPPAFGLMGLLSMVFLGSGAMARTALVVAALPVGAWGAYRLARPLSALPWPALAAAVVYGTIPVPRNAIAQGRLDALVWYVLLPFLVERLVRAGGADPYGGREAFVGRRPELRRIVLSLALLTAIAAAFCPPALVLVPAVAAVLVVAALLTGGTYAALRSLAAAVLGTALAAVMLLPWAWSLVRPDPDGGSMGVVFHPRFGVGSLLHFDTGPAPGGPLVFALLAVAVLPLLLGSGWRVTWAGRGWLLALAGWAGAWVPGRDWFRVAWPAPEVPLAVAAIGLAFACACGVAVFVDETRRHRFGWRQLAGVAMVLGLVGTLPFVAEAGDGRLHLPGRDWDRTFRWMQADVAAEGHFRVLWAGRPQDLPGAPQLTYGELGYTLTRDGANDARTLWPAPEDKASHEIEDVLALTVDGRTTRVGHLLAPLAVRYIVIPIGGSPGPADDTPESVLADSPAVAAGPARLAAALARQTDLVRLSVGTAIVYRNEAAAPARANLRLDELAAVTGASSLAEATGVELSRSLPALPDGDRLEVRGPVEASGVLLAERYDERWRPHGTDAIEHTKAFGVTNAYAVPTAAELRLSYAVPFGHRLTVAAQVLVWLLVLVALRQRMNAARLVVPPLHEPPPDVPRRRRKALLDELTLDTDDEIELPLTRRERRQQRSRAAVSAGERAP